MGNLKTAALACGVVASVLGGGFGVAYITSSTVSTADIVNEDNTGIVNTGNVISSMSADLSAATENATAIKRTTTKKSYTANNTQAASKDTNIAQEGTTSLYGAEVATTVAAQISRSVPAPAHAPAAITQPATQATTTAAIIAEVVEKITTAPKPVVTTTETTTTTTTTTTTEAETTTTEEYVEPTTEAPQAATETYVEPETEPVAIDVEVNEGEGSLPISDEEYILLCNCVANEAGSNWISTDDKALVVEVIMNRVESPRFPNTIKEVITQPYQFSGSSRYAYLDTFTAYVTQSVKDAVKKYFDEKESFTQGYLGFWGDGYSNHFY